MSRPRLRSTDGCDICRYRRKKCDTVKPTCGACTRLGLACAWGFASKQSKAVVPVVSGLVDLRIAKGIRNQQPAPGAPGVVVAGLDQFSSR